MTRLNWDAIGKRFFEAGVDRGVLYVAGLTPVPWTGLISVSESPSGGEATPYYIDGVKYLNVASSTEFEATISAFTYPDEFQACEGVEEVDNGLFTTQGRRETFSLAYRTMVGNDTDGPEHGYKLHIVYDALAAPTQLDYNTLGDNPSPLNFSWKITTKPALISGRKPNAHFVIDSRKTPSTLLSTIEDILYGSDLEDARLPTAQELVDLFKEFV